MEEISIRLECPNLAHGSCVDPYWSARLHVGFPAPLVELPAFTLQPRQERWSFRARIVVEKTNVYD